MSASPQPSIPKQVDPKGVQRHHFGPGIYAKELRIRKGMMIVGHAHKYDHFSILSKGWAMVEVDGKETPYAPGTLVLIKAGKRHTVTAVDDIVWFCVHATEEVDPDKVDDVLIEKGQHAGL